MSQQNRSVRFIGATLLILGLVLQGVLPLIAAAEQIPFRELVLQAGSGGDGGSKPGGTVNHQINFNIPTAGKTIGLIKFEYCTTAANSVTTPACVLPTGLNPAAATLSAQSGVTGFTLFTGPLATDQVYMTRVAAVAPVGNVSYTLAGVVNPTNKNETFFIRISAYATTDIVVANNPATVAEFTGTIAASTADQILLSGIMPESLVFCTGRTVGVSVVTSLPDCSTATPGVVTFNKLFSPTDTSTATSQMAASTNAGSGYSITIHGPTLTSSANTISAIATASAIARGTSQFGLNLKANTASTSDPVAGTEVSPAPNGSSYKGQAAPGYDSADSFQFVSGDSVAKSDYLNPTTKVLGGTDAQIFTATYIVNVPGSQPAGTYNTTLTYICTATF